MRLAMGSSHSVRIFMAINLNIVGRILHHQVHANNHMSMQDWLQKDLAIQVSEEALPDTFHMSDAQWSDRLKQREE